MASLGSLDDPIRRRLYTHIAEQGDPVTRDQAATVAGIGRTLAAYHLDKLAEAGLLMVSYARPPGRGGPGAGRPAKLYRLPAEELAISVPPRAYDLLAMLLVDSMEQDPDGNLRSTVQRVARETGRRMAVESDTDLLGTLRACGYQPREDRDAKGRVVELRNCPFHRLAIEHRELVCGLNLSLVEGVIAGSGSRARAALDPHPNRCCVVLRGVPRGDVTNPVQPTSEPTTEEHGHAVHGRNRRRTRLPGAS